MSKSGKWDCVSRSDSNQFGNCPLQVSNDFSHEIDQNPSAWRRRDHYEWMGKGFISPQEIESFHRDTTKLSQETDTDTIDDFYVGKEILMGAVVESKSINFGGWSIVVRTVIRWEEISLKRQKIKVQYREPKPNPKPSDLKRWEETHERRSHTRLIRTNRRNVRRRPRNTVNLGNASK